MAVSAVVQPALATATAVPTLSEPKRRAAVTPVSAKAWTGDIVRAVPTISKLANVFVVKFFIK
ncbi:hypothetical protein SDC9_200581 [bioreactor metagenome]|uniref:Uncharacterized protein n=1 Tax=bioreactor metagenome TaxID=1076179 RepID=A0A645INL6_9ZZZZ